MRVLWFALLVGCTAFWLLAAAYQINGTLVADQVLIGCDEPLIGEAFEQCGEISRESFHVIIRYNGNGVIPDRIPGGPNVALLTSRGTKDEPLPLVDNHPLGCYHFWAGNGEPLSYDFTTNTGSGSHGSARICARVDGDPTASSTPSRIELMTTNADGIQRNRLVITSSGEILFNGEDRFADIEARLEELEGP